MLVATFGASTGWHRRQITHENGSFILEGHGVIPARALLDYDRQGQIDWAYAGLREWVQQLGCGPTVAAQPGEPSPPGRLLPSQPAQVGVAGFALSLAGFVVPLLWIVGLILSWRDVKRARRESLPHGLATAGLVISSVGVALLIAGVIASIAIPMFLVQHEKAAKETEVKEGIRSIQIGVRSWAIDHGDAYPDVSLVNRFGLAGYVPTWPTNPFTGLPMNEGTGPGQYVYERTASGFRIIAYGAGGRAIIAAP